MNKYFDNFSFKISFVIASLFFGVVVYAMNFYYPRVPHHVSDEWAMLKKTKNNYDQKSKMLLAAQKRYTPGDEINRNMSSSCSIVRGRALAQMEKNKNAVQEAYQEEKKARIGFLKAREEFLSALNDTKK